MKPSEQPYLSPEETARFSRLAYILDGRVKIVAARPGSVHAEVHGHDEVWTVLYRDGAWRCSCASARVPCGHVRAVALVAAEPPPRTGDGIGSPIRRTTPEPLRRNGMNHRARDLPGRRPR